MTVLNLSRLTACAIFIWLGLLVYISTVLVRVQQNAQLAGISGDSAKGGGVGEEALRRIKQAAEDIEALKRQNEELKTLLFRSSNAVARGLEGRNVKEAFGSGLAHLR